MMTRAIRFVAAASLAAVPPLAAQSAGTVEIGAFARYTDFDNSLAMNNAVGVGGQVTVYVAHVGRPPGGRLDQLHSDAHPAGTGVRYGQPARPVAGRRRRPQRVRWSAG